MLTVLLTVCLVSAPADCHEARVAIEADATPMMCVVRAQAYAAQWASEHPAYTVRAWRCGRDIGREA